MRITSLLFKIIVPLLLLCSAAGAAYAADIGVQLQIPIAGKTSFTVCHPGPTTSAGTQLLCTGIGEYITVVYKWAIGFAAVLAVIALTWGGVLWMTAGGGKRTDEAKKVMTNAIAGLLLALCSYLLLAAINPDLVNFRPVSVTSIQPLKLIFDEADIIHNDSETGSSFPEIGQANVPYFSQGDTRWNSMTNPKTGKTIGNSGCGITAFAMVAKFYGVATDPADVFQKNGQDNTGDFVKLAGIYGLKSEQLSNFDKVNQLLSNKEPVIIYTANKGFTGWEKHFIVIAGFDGTNYLINDPGKRIRITATREDLTKNALYYVHVHK